MEKKYKSPPTYFKSLTSISISGDISTRSFLLSDLLRVTAEWMSHTTSLPYSNVIIWGQVSILYISIRVFMN